MNVQGSLLITISTFLFVVFVSAQKQNRVCPSFDWTDVQGVVSSGVEVKAYPGAAWMVGSECGVIGFGSSGTLTYPGLLPPNGPNYYVDSETLFDLASLTKVLTTTTVAMQLYQNNLLDLDLPVSDTSLLGEQFAQYNKDKITSRHLLLHNSGFPPGPVPLFSSNQTGCPETLNPIPGLSFSCRDKLYKSLMSQKLDYAIGAKTVYSDLSMITLMYVIGKIVMDKSLISEKDLIPECYNQIGQGVEQCYFEAYVRKTVFQRLNMTQTTFIVDPNQYPFTSPSWFDSPYRPFMMQGVVSDPNAYALGGVSGHAGMFSTANDIRKLLHVILFASIDDPWINQNTVQYFSKVADSTKSTRALGWDTNSALTSSCSNQLSSSTFLHTGYTGTQVCLDPTVQIKDVPVKGIYTIFLTNRCHPDDSDYSVTEMARLRKEFNAAVSKSIKEAVQ